MEGTSRWTTSPRFEVRHVRTLSSSTGSVSFSTTEERSFNDLLRLVNSTSEGFGLRPVVSGKGVGPKVSGRRMAFRWAWEVETVYGDRASDVLWVRVKSWN